MLLCAAYSCRNIERTIYATIYEGEVMKNKIINDLKWCMLIIIAMPILMISYIFKKFNPTVKNKSTKHDCHDINCKRKKYNE